jgi:hypothetical protein
MSLSYQQILALAPDDASAKAGVQLANPAKWLLKAAHPQALWGECQGSGSTPYKTYIDLTNVAFKCSCPSRKFPCKHGLGLFLLHANKPGDFAEQATLPPEVEEWLGKRAAKTEAKEQKVAKPVDEASQQKRVDARETKISRGIEELKTWLQDVARTGIMNVPQDLYQFNANIIARMNDAQATGLAYQLRKMNQLNFYQDGWQKDLTRLLARTYALADAYTRREQFDEPLREDLASLIGWKKSREEVLQQPAVRDQWLTVAKWSVQEDALTAETTWFFGRQSGRFALLLNYFAWGQRPTDLWVVGNVLDAEMAYYPGTYPFRALVKTQAQQAPAANFPLVGLESLEALKDQVAEVLAVAPFSEQLPFMLGGLRLAIQGQQYYLVDQHAKALPLANGPAVGWQVAALTKGRAFTSFVTYDNGQLTVRTLWDGNKIFTFA